MCSTTSIRAAFSPFGEQSHGTDHASSASSVEDDDVLVLNMGDDTDGLSPNPEDGFKTGSGDRTSKDAGKGASNDALSRRLLIVDDEEILVQMLAKLFRASYDVRFAISGSEAMSILEGGFAPEVIIADQRMPGMSGAEFLGKSMAYVPMAVRVVLTGYTDVNDIISSINQGHVYRFITKPWNPEELMEAVRLSFEHHNVITQNAALQQALSTLEVLNREKNDLIGIVAHDLKNPLSAIRLVVEALLADANPNDTQVFLRLIQTSTDRALELITNLLNVEALDRGGYTLDIVPIDAHFIIADLVVQYRVAAAAKSIAIHWDVERPLTVLAEEQALRQVMDNLISNAVKYSPHGANVWIDARVIHATPDRLKSTPTQSMEPTVSTEDGSHPSWLLVSVRDEGPGFTDEDKQRVFGKFARLSAQPTGGESSTGLGLSIVKRYVEAMGGDIWLENNFENNSESTSSAGSVFMLALPCGD
jgi:two-component system, sensor histidine kinase and response regulator